MIDLFAILQSARRREILRLCWEQPVRAGDIRAALPDVTFGAISQHLAVLRSAGLVTVEPRGRARLYRARQAALGPVRKWLETAWDDALYRLKLAAELEAARRGPRPETPNVAAAGASSRTPASRRRDRSGARHRRTRNHGQP